MSSVQYKASSVTISENVNQDLMVYSHPGDRISFDFDISALNKEIINGDLVIHLLNGRTITVVNFGLMVLDNKSPILEDANKTYTPFSLFGGQAYYEGDVGRYVISRIISSPEKLPALEGTELPTSKELADGEGVFSKQVGNFLTPEQSLIPEFAPLVQDYVSKTLQQPYLKLYESDVDYTSKNQFIYNEVNSDIFPVKLLIINPRITPEYGTDYRHEASKNEKHKGYSDLFIDIGGGKLKGDEYAHLMYTPAIIDLSRERENFWFDGPEQSTKIIRYFHVGVPSQSVLFTKVVISGLPASISVISRPNSNLEIKPLGSGTYEIAIRGNAAGGVEIPIEYPIGVGGEAGLFAPVGISYEGVQAKSGDLIRGNNTVYFEFKPVRGPDDVSNFNKYNTYTYSTLRDPLVIRFGTGNDVIKGGEGDYIYYGTAGDNKAYGGKATEEFHLGTGNNKFYAGLGNDTVDVESPDKDNKLYLSDAIIAADKDSVVTTVDQGGIIFTGKKNGVTFESFIKNFSHVYFDIGDEEKVVSRDDTAIINSTWGALTNTTLYMGKGNNTIKAASNKILVDFKEVNNGGKKLFITTHDTRYGVFVIWEQGDNKVIGSKFDDIIKGYNDNDNLTYYGNGGTNTADYSAVTVSLVYDASSGLASREGFSSLDKVLGIHNFIGGSSKNTFYGAIYYTYFDGTKKQADINFIGNNSSKLSYEKLDSITADDKKNNGVIIDLGKNTVTKIKTGGQDVFYKIDNIIASNNNDTFIISSEIKSNDLNGLGGFNTIDYSRSVVLVDFNILEQGGGTVIKGGGTHGIDVISNFRHFIGSTVGSTFSLNDFTFNDKEPYRFIVEGKANILSNRVNYSTINGKAVVLDLRIGESTIVTMYTGKNTESTILGKDSLANIGVFGLTNDADNIVYMYSSEQLRYIIDGGTNGSCLISFERASSAISLNLHTFNYSNLNGINVLKLSKNNDKIIMGSGFFGQEIDGNEGINEIDFSNLIAPIITQLDLENIVIEKINISTRNVKVRNFQRIISTSSDDYFDIKFDLDHISKIKDKDIYLDGSQGTNTISFDSVISNTVASEGLIIDISDGILTKVTDSKHNKLLNFINFNRIIGSKGDDIFILPVSAFDFYIDGGKGVNTVSYQAYTNGINISEDTLSKFKNIQKIIGSQGNDNITLTENTSLLVDGFAGFNTATYVGTINAAVKVEITDNLLSVIKGDKTDLLNRVEFIDFFSAKLTNGVTFYIKTKVNTNIVSGSTLYLSGSKPINGVNKDRVDFSSLDSGVILNLDIQSNLAARGYWINVNKGNNNIDYLQNISYITLSNNSQVNVYNSIGALSDIGKIEIDGGGTGSLSFSQYSATLIIDVSAASVKFSPTLEIIFKGFNSFEGTGDSSYSTTFLSNDDKSYTFNGLLSLSKLSYEKISKDLDVIVNSANEKGYNALLVKKSNNTDTGYNIFHLRGSKGNTNVVLENEVSHDMTFEAEANSKSRISYEKINNADTLTFTINKDGIQAGRSNGLYKDNIINFSQIMGSKGNNRFEIDTSILQTSTVYNIDGGSGVNTINFVNFDADILFKMDRNSQSIKVNLGQRDFGTVVNMSTIFGTSTKTNTFILGNYFNQPTTDVSKQLIIYGNSSSNAKDILDLRDTDKSLSLDPLTGTITVIGVSTYFYFNKAIANGYYLKALTGVHTINLGSGNHQVDVSSGMSSVGWKVINGGSGQNNVSFAKVITGIRYDLSSGVKDLGFQLVNFSGVTGSKGNDLFLLKAVNETYKGIRIDGYEGTLNTLDFSDLNVAIKVDLGAAKVTRGNITDTVVNVQIFKSGKGGGVFSSTFAGSYKFIGHIDTISSNILSYAGVDHDLKFEFNINNVSKNGPHSDTFENITRFVGGSKINTFIFTTDNYKKGNFSEIILDGGTGINNIVDLKQLSMGIIYDIESKFFTVNFNNKQLKVKLENIHQVIGTEHSDTFIFSDNVNNFQANGGASSAKVKNTVNLVKVSSSVTVDFSTQQILFGNNKNSFANIDRFIGSKVGGNIFKGLTTNNSYDIDGGSDGDTGGGNTVDYSGASTALSLLVKDGKIHINKSKNGNNFDTFKNIHNIVLSSFRDEIIFNSSSDLNVYKIFKKIDGSSADNLVTFSENVVSNNILIDIDAGNIKIGNVSQDIKLVGFNSWKFLNGSGTHTIIAGSGNFNFRLIEFGVNNKSTVDLRKVTENLTVSILEDGYSATIVSTASSSRGNFINLKNLLLGSKNYYLTFAKFNPHSTGVINIKADPAASMNLSITEYLGTTASINFLGKDIQLDSSKFSNVNNLFIKSAPQNVNLTVNKLAANVTTNFYLSNLEIANNLVNLNINLGATNPNEANITVNSNNFIIKQNGSTFIGTILTNNGVVKIIGTSTLVINTLDTPFKIIETLGSGGSNSNDGIIDFSGLPYSSFGIEYNVAVDNDKTFSMSVKEGNSNKYKYTVKFRENRTILGSTNNDTFIIDTSKVSGFSFAIIENGPLTSVNTLKINASKLNKSSIKISSEGISDNNTNIKFSGNRGINNIIISNIVVNNIEIGVNPSLTNVNIVPGGSINKDLATNVKLKSSDASSGPMNVKMIFNNTTPLYGVLDIFYSKGNINVNGFKASNRISTVEVDVNNDDITTKDDYFSISHTNFFPSGTIFSFMYKMADADTKRNFLNKVTPTLDMTRVPIGGKGFELSTTLNTNNSQILESILKFNSSSVGFSINYFKNVLLNRTEADSNSVSDKAIINVNIDDPSALNFNIKYSFGTLSNMKLPKYYRILSDHSNGDYPGSSKYPIWTNGAGNGKENPINYDTYNNIFMLRGGNSSTNFTIYADLLLNNNNESVFSVSSSAPQAGQASGVTVAGANLFWLTGNPSYIKVHELSRAKPFALMLNKADGNIIDFSGVKDGQSYLFRFIYSMFGREYQPITTITNNPKYPGEVPLDDSMKVYGSFAGAKNIILTSATNTLYVHGEFNPNIYKHIDGGSGLSTISFAANLSQHRVLDLTAGDNKGFRIWNYNTSKPVDVLFTNIKIIENGYRNAFDSLTVIFRSDSRFDEHYEHNFILKQPDNISVTQWRPYYLKDQSSSNSYQLNAYMNNEYMLFSDDRTAKGNNLTIMSKDFAANWVTCNTMSFILGLKLDFSRIKDVGNYKITLDASKLFRLYLPEGDGNNLNYVIDLDRDRKILVLKSKTYNTQITITIKTKELSIYRPHYSSSPVSDDEIDSSVSNPQPLRSKRSTDENNTNVNEEYYDYYEYLAMHPIYQLTEGDNSYKKDYATNVTQKVMGAYIWSNQYEYEKSLTTQVVSDEYWKDIDIRIKNAFSVKNINEDIVDTVIISDEVDSKDNNILKEVNDNQDEFIDSFNNELEFNNYNSEVVDEDAHLRDDNFSDDTHQIGFEDTIANNVNQLNDSESIDGFSSNSNNASTTEVFDLNSILEAAKAITNNNENNNSNILNCLSIDSIPSEVIENMYLQDEANSMAYTIDTGNGAMSNLHSSLDQVNESSSIQEQQKIKLSY